MIAIINNKERLENIQNIRISENNTVIITYLSNYGSINLSVPMSKISKLELVTQ